MERESKPAQSESTPGGGSRSLPTVSGLEVRVSVKELSSQVGSYISNIRALGQAQLFTLRTGAATAAEDPSHLEGDVDLVLSPRFGAWITKRPGYTTTSDFTTSLRAELLRRRLEGVSQHDLDRVIIFRLSGRTDTVRLILELMPPGNIIVTDDAGKILLALRESRSPARSTVRGRLYSPPPQTRASPDRIDAEALLDSLSREKTAGKALGRSVSLPRKYVDEILSRANLGQDAPSSSLSMETAAMIAETTRKLIGELDSPTPALVRRHGVEEILSVVPSGGTEIVSRTTSMSELMDEVFMPVILEEEETQAAEEAPGSGGKARELEVTLERLGQRESQLMLESSRLRELAQRVRTAASTEEARALLQQAGEGEDERKQKREESNATAASRIYDEAKRHEAEVLRIREAEEDIRAKLEREVERPSGTVSRVKVIKRERKEWYEKFRWFFTTEGRLAVGGRDAQSNSLLLKRHATDGDVVYHADLFGSPFFVLKDGRGRQTEAEIRQVGQATAAFSSAWKTGLASADAYWVDPEQVSSTAPSGEYLAKGSFVIRGSKNFVTRNPVEVSVGLDEKGRVVAGPEEAVMRRSRAHVTLVPHREKPSDTAKKVLQELKRHFPQELSGVGVDDVLRVLPAGGGKIVRRRENWKTEGEVKGPDPGQ